MDLKFIEHGSSYYVVDSVKIEKKTSIYPPIDIIKIRGEEKSINTDNSYGRSSFNYVTDKDMIEKLTGIYKEFLSRKTTNVCIIFQHKIGENDICKVLELGDNSTAIIEIHFFKSNI
ncbi:hypothetical protein EV201_1212 [Ancylomarina subtilis]|uniref:Uncharacterized protein n=1 Tax=Ancylomarina subtilis TaxID=1639035 RepID=A0A4Q7VKB8_9BACT|nr:hypothetical protein [Ancylomarina subtilis]RZT96574.1 hypothetical protein EV201_1212 [Ancylomarina subtilis]